MDTSESNIIIISCCIKKKVRWFSKVIVIFIAAQNTENLRLLICTSTNDGVTVLMNLGQFCFGFFFFSLYSVLRMADTTNFLEFLSTLYQTLITL